MAAPPSGPARWVALLRGINVGQARRIAMADLKALMEALMEALGYTDVRTLLNSGNVVFSAAPSRQAPAAHAQRIQAAVARQLGVAAPVRVLAAEDLQAALAGNPLRTLATDASRLLPAFAQDAATLGALADLATPPTNPRAGALVLGPQAAYVGCPDGVLASPLAQALDRRLGDRVTTRNMATAEKIVARL